MDHTRAYTVITMNTKRIRILLADDDPALRSALALILETRLNASVVGQSTSMESLLDNLQLDRPDMVILDSDLPGAPKRDRIRFLHTIFPGLKVVLIGPQPEVLGPMAARYADAYISKCEPPEQMVQALRAI